MKPRYLTPILSVKRKFAESHSRAIVQGHADWHAIQLFQQFDPRFSELDAITIEIYVGSRNRYS